MTDPIPDNVIAALAEVRETGKTNMYDSNAVMRIASDLDHFDAFTWLYNNEHRYMEALKRMGAERETPA